MAARSPEECSTLFAEYLNAADVDAVVALYEPGATLAMEHGGAAAGTAAIRNAIAAFAGMRPRVRAHVTRVVRSGDDLAVVYNDWTLTMARPDGSTASDAGRAVEIVRRQPDGTWRFVLDDPRARG
jgi:uncharacterized protein (TIGR02246 family)